MSMGEEKETTDEDGNILIEIRLPSSGAIDDWLAEKAKEGHTIRSRGFDNNGLDWGIVIKKKDADQ